MSTGPDSLVSKRAGKQTLPASSCPPPPPLSAVKYSHWKHFPEHSPKRKDGKAFGNMKYDNGSSSLHGRVCSMAKLFCDLFLIGGVF